VIPNGHAPGLWKWPSPSPARSHARSSLSMPRTRSGSMPNFSTHPPTCPRAACAPGGRVAGVAVVVRRGQDDGGRAPAQLVGTESGSNNRRSSPSSIAYDDTSSGHHSSSFQPGCDDCQCHTLNRNSRMGTVCQLAWVQTTNALVRSSLKRHSRTLAQRAVPSREPSGGLDARPAEAGG